MGSALLKKQGHSINFLRDDGKSWKSINKRVYLPQTPNRPIYRRDSFIQKRIQIHHWFLTLRVYLSAKTSFTRITSLNQGWEFGYKNAKRKSVYPSNLKRFTRRAKPNPKDNYNPGKNTNSFAINKYWKQKQAFWKFWWTCLGRRWRLSRNWSRKESEEGSFTRCHSNWI